MDFPMDTSVKWNANNLIQNLNSDRRLIYKNDNRYATIEGYLFFQDW